MQGGAVGRLRKVTVERTRAPLCAWVAVTVAVSWRDESVIFDGSSAPGPIAADARWRVA